MRTIAPLVRCDPARRERIRLKERLNKDGEKQMSSSSSVPLSVELAEECRSAPSAPNTMATRNTTMEFRANEDQKTKQHDKRKDFDEQIQRDIELQASRAAKRRKTSDAKPNPACKNLENFEFKTAREKADHKKRKAHTDPDKCISLGGNRRDEQAAIFRLLSRGDWREPQAGKQRHRLGGATESE